jgi:hypothetical protein|tara:strand:+ start:178 stop:678 length:501 start_codon:yes stop_codon:yes gene_type:complete
MVKLTKMLRGVILPLALAGTLGACFDEDKPKPQADLSYIPDCKSGYSSFSSDNQISIKGDAGILYFNECGEGVNEQGDRAYIKKFIFIPNNPSQGEAKIMRSLVYPAGLASTGKDRGKKALEDQRNGISEQVRELFFQKKKGDAFDIVKIRCDSNPTFLECDGGEL